MKKIIFKTLILAAIVFISCSKESEEIPDTTPPIVSFSIKGVTQIDMEETPVIGNVIEIEINAEDAKGISKVEAFLNDSKVGEATQSPFKITVNLKQYSKKLSGKGTVLSKTRILYNLKISATDLSGNVSSIEKEIIIDNEMPTITEVSLETNSVIGGEENQVVFSASDNKKIMSLEVKVNELVIETTAIDSITFAININTSNLEDGINNLNITVSDQAANTAIYNGPFVVDNSGPDISLQGLSSENSVIDENTTFTISSEDAYSEVKSLEVFVNDTLIISSDDGSELILDFNPDDYATGNAILKINTIDALGNESTQETNFQIKRLLLKINIPSGFLDPTISKFYVFASSNTGAVLDIKPLEYNTSLIKLNTFEDVSLDTEYMLNFAYLYSGVGTTSIIKTIQNVKRATLDKINLKIPERKNISTQNTYQASTMPTGISIVGEGSDYNSTLDPQNPANGYYIEDYALTYTNITSNKYYVYYHNTSNNNYGYQFIDKPLNNNFILDYNNFITDGVEARYLNSTSIQDPNKSSSIMLYGYLDATEFNNNIKHRIWGHGNGNSIIMNGPGLRYDFNTNFYNYCYEATLENYRVEAIGEPLDNYTAPNWSVDYSYSNANKTFTLNITGTTHNVGKISMDLIDNNSFYTWTVLFNSQSTSEVKLPELPQELKSWNINNYYATGNLNIEQIEVKKYDGLNTYDDFLNTIIKNNEYNQHKVSNKTESIFKTNVGAYSSRPDFSFYY